jgi:glyoxylase-like metal-dependent hydrolase (beta-lactamase superfamily II)
VVRTPRWTAIVDTCCGNHKERPGAPFWHRLNQPYLENMQALGIHPDEVDFVMCTHLHVDHVGWNTRLAGNAWVPTFPNATYLFGRTEYDFWNGFEESREQSAVFADSIKPVVDAGQAELIADEYRVADEVGTFATPGHSPGHLSVRIRSEGEEAVLLGDVAHHPCQFEHLDWSSTFDSDPAGSAAMRKKLFAALAGSKVRVFGGHFDPGYVVAAGSAFRLMEKPEK